MKTTAFAAAAMALLVMASCSNNETKTSEKQPETKTDTKVESASFDPTTNIRYYNMDSVMANYELVKAFNEANLRTMTELQNAQRSREGVIAGKVTATLIGNINNLCDYNYVKDAYTSSGTAGSWENAYRVFYSFGRTYSIKLKINF